MKRSYIGSVGVKRPRGNSEKHGQGIALFSDGDSYQKRNGDSSSRRRCEGQGTAEAGTREVFGEGDPYLKFSSSMDAL